MPLDNLDSVIDQSHADFTVGFMLNKLASAGKLGPSGLDSVDNVSITQMSTGGFLSDLYRIRIQFKIDNNNTTPTAFTCILKVWMYNVHNSECRFYSSVAPLLYAMPVSPPFRIPELYACRPATSPDCLAGGFLLLEDVSGNDVIEIEPTQGLTKEQTESAIRGLAHFHALCLCLPRQLVNSFTLKTDLDFDDKELRITERLMAMPQCAQLFAGHEQALQKLYSDFGHYKSDQHKMFSVAPVIVHGDYWANNMFFKTSHDKKVDAQLSAMFDWQVCHSGTGVNDLLRIIYVSVDAPLRRLHFDDWLSLYCLELNSVLTRLAKDYPQATDQQVQRSPAMIRQMAAHHSGYELCFQLFLLTNILGTEQDELKRLKLMKRMAELYDDVKKEIKLF